MLLISKELNAMIPAEKIDVIRLIDDDEKVLMTAQVGNIKYLLAAYDSRDAANESLIDIAAAWHEQIAIRVK